MIPFSVLDLAPIIRGGDAAGALRNTVDLARHAEAWGYRRYWLAEHHNMPGIASAATAVVIGHVAGATSAIRVGAGGIMLPNHAPLVIAEQFGTLAALYPGRIDLGLGRAPGSDQATARALRRARSEGDDEFPRDVVELLGYLAPDRPGKRIRAIPGSGSQIPVWLLGSSLFSARLAAQLGLRFAFAAHFAPQQIAAALTEYRSRFQPSAALAQPYAMVALGIVAAETDAAAARWFSSLQQQFLALRFGEPGELPPPVDRLDGQWSQAQLAVIEHALARAIVGGPDTVRRGIAAIIAEVAPDELMVTAQIYDHAARLRSFEIVAGVRAALAGET